MDTPRCIAMAKGTGQRCKRRPIPGGRVCVIHGGASPQARAAAERRKAEAEATALLEQVWRPDAPPVTNVVDALHKMAGQLQHSVNVLGARASTEDLGGPAALAWRSIVREQRQLLVEIARLNIEERFVQLEQRRADLVTAAFRAAVEAVSLSPDDRQTLIETFLGRLRPAVAPGGDVVRGEVE